MVKNISDIKKGEFTLSRVTVGERIFSVVNYFIMILLIIVCLYPMLYVVFASFSDPIQMMGSNGLLWKPLGFSFEAYKEVFRNPNILIGYRNTLFYVIAGTAFSVMLTIFGAFVLSRKEFYIKKPMNLFIVFTMFFNGGLIPTFLLVKGVGLYNNPLVLILPTAINTWNLMVMRTSFAAIPESLEESAHIDGANDLVVLFKIIMPLSKSIITVIVLFYGVGIWNGWFNASIYLKDRDFYPLQLFLREVLIYSNTDSMMTGSGSATDRVGISETIKYAMIVVATLPILLSYPFMQKYFVNGVMIGAVKG